MITANGWLPESPIHKAKKDWMIDEVVQLKPRYT